MQERQCPRCKRILLKAGVLRCSYCGKDLTPPKKAKTFDEVLEDVTTARYVENQRMFNPDAFTDRMPIQERYVAQQTPEGQAACKVQRELAEKRAQVTGKPVKSGIVKAIFDANNPGTILQYYED